MYSTYALHKINNPDHFGFSAVDYSRFKFGDGRVSDKFGKQLAEGFLKDVLEKDYDGTQIVVVSSPYSYIPTATFALKTAFAYELNKWLAKNDFPVVQEAKIYRTITYSVDYGTLNAAERMALISNDIFYVDKNYLKDKLVIFLDDIRITGSHERVVRKMLKDLDIENDYYLLYYAQLVNDSIHPNIENELNYAFVKSIFSLNELINMDKFIINTRIVKYILNADFETFKIFIDDQKKDFLNLLHDKALGNSYHTIEDYQQNFAYLEQLLSFHKLKKENNGN